MRREKTGHSPSGANLGAVEMATPGVGRNTLYETRAGWVRQVEIAPRRVPVRSK